MKEINLEQILKDSWDNNSRAPEYSKSNLHNSYRDIVLSAMREAVRQALELAADNVTTALVNAGEVDNNSNVVFHRPFLPPTIIRDTIKQLK